MLGFMLPTITPSEAPVQGGIGTDSWEERVAASTDGDRWVLVSVHSSGSVLLRTGTAEPTDFVGCIAANSRSGHRCMRIPSGESLYAHRSGTTNVSGVIEVYDRFPWGGSVDAS